jgi:hypothetical protein
VLKHPGWKPKRYAAKRAAKVASVHLPALVLRRLTMELGVVANSFDVEIAQVTLSRWIDNNVASHYRIFAEYLLHVKEEYLPGPARTALNFLDLPGDEVERVVMPFVALKAVKKVKNRRDLVERVLDWRDGEGRKVAEGIDHLQHVMRMVPNEKRRKQLEEVEKLLESNFRMGFRIMLTFLRVPSGGFSGADEAVPILRRMGTYRWLWRIRSPQLHEKWSRRVQELMR